MIAQAAGGEEDQHILPTSPEDCRQEGTARSKAQAKERAYQGSQPRTGRVPSKGGMNPWSPTGGDGVRYHRDAEVKTSAHFRRQSFKSGGHYEEKADSTEDGHDEQVMDDLVSKHASGRG